MLDRHNGDVKPPKTKPQWWWTWARWKLGHGEFKHRAGDPKIRPKTPKPLPKWAVPEFNRLFVKPKPVPSPPPTPPVAKNPATGRNGFYFYTARNAQIGLSGIIQACKQHDLWVALLVHNVFNPATEDNNPPGWRQTLQSEGITVVCSGWLDSRVDLKEQAVAVAYYSQGFDEYLANVENGTGWGYGGAGFTASDEFCPMVRARTQIPVSVSIEHGEPLHFKPWLDIGMEVVRPQCYWNQIPYMTPASAVDRAGGAQHDLPGGIEPWRVEPTYGKYGQWQPPLSAYEPLHVEAHKKGVRACSQWASEFLDDADVLALARMR